ncbi:hypothetical protein K438DRAFT_1973976 [Mycena galopus ATCC 62051]|nr:hypothetical protein K438DRAFT_1973976 [Mycena galopus ATCC 62051]
MAVIGAVMLVIISGAQVVAVEAILEAIIRVATQSSETRSSRDKETLIWIVKSLSDEVELESFVQAIPRTLRGLGVRGDSLGRPPIGYAHDVEIPQVSISNYGLILTTNVPFSTSRKGTDLIGVRDDFSLPAFGGDRLHKSATATRLRGSSKI